MTETPAVYQRAGAVGLGEEPAAPNQTTKCPAGISSDCAGGDLPICADRKPDGTRHSHAETCATYRWALDACEPCSLVLEEDASALTSQTPTCIDCDGPLDRPCCRRYLCCHCDRLLDYDPKRLANYRDRGWLL